MIGCSCHKCGAIVPASVEKHFVAFDGRILCENCSVGVEPCSEATKISLIEYERSKNDD